MNKRKTHIKQADKTDKRKKHTNTEKKQEGRLKERTGSIRSGINQTDAERHAETGRPTDC